MCGIAGFATLPGRRPLSRERLLRMTRSIAHRGPDGESLWTDGPVGLGHRRLAIIDVAGGDNPLEDGDERVALVFNGEIYNHLALRAELEAAGCRPRTGSDGEVIVHGYLLWGLFGMLRRLRGMFAFALHDRRSGELHLARDPLGIKPLHVAEHPGGIVFGSEMKAVVEGLGGRPPVDPVGWLQTVTLGYTLSPTTLLSGVESLAPGTCLTWSGGSVRRRRHHELVFEPGVEPADPDALWEHLSSSVRCHLMSEVPLGAFLSGGIDSTAVVTSMAQIVPGRVDAVSVGVLGDGLDERPFAREVAAALGVVLHEETATPDIVDLLPRLAWHLEIPFGDTSAAPTWLVCEAARRHVTVALSGDGGDENFAGYRRTRYDVLEERVRRQIPGPVRRGVAGPLGRLWPRRAWVPRPLRAGTLLENLSGDWLDGWLRSLARIPESRARELIPPDLRPDGALRDTVAGHAARVAHLDPLSRVLAMDFATWLTDDILVKVDRTSMAHGLEVRVPLLDTRFVEWAAGLPPEAKLDAGEGKRLFRRALRGRVPDGVLDRPKQGFHLPVASWLAGPLRPALDEVLATPGAPVFSLLDHGRLSRAAAEHAAGRADRSAELWLLLVTDAWWRHGPGSPGAGATDASLVAG